MSALDDLQRALDAAEKEMVEGYLDGFRLDNPEPSGNRSLSYHHGFMNGRADITHKLRPFTVDQLRHIADCAIAIDAGAASAFDRGRTEVSRALFAS